MLTCLLVAGCFVCSECTATGVTVGFPVRVAPMAHVCQRLRHYRSRPMLSVACKHEGATNIHCSPRVCDLIWGFTMDMAAQGMAVLVTYNAAAPVCPYFTIVQAAAAAGATTVVFAMAQGQPYINLNCNGTAQCNTALGVSASVIDYAAGQALQNAIAAAPPGTVNVSIVNNKTSGFYFGIDHRGQLVQVVRIVLGSWVADAVALSTCSERCSRVCVCVRVSGLGKVPMDENIVVGSPMVGVHPRTVHELDKASPHRAHLWPHHHERRPWSRRECYVATHGGAHQVQQHGAGHGAGLPGYSGQPVPYLGPHGAAVCMLQRRGRFTRSMLVGSLPSLMPGAHCCLWCWCAVHSRRLV